MSTKTDCLIDYVRSSHDGLATRLEAARLMQSTRDDPRLERHRIDDFLGATCQHLHAVDGVMLREYANLPDGKALCRAFTTSVRHLEVLLYHVNAHEYGSSIEGSFDWPAVWADVEQAMTDERTHEEELAGRLTDALDDDVLADLTARVRRVEPQQPTRPHPHQPHKGMLGRFSRWAMRRTDAFWDAAQGRIVPEPAHEPKKKPGLLGQYLLASPRFGQDEDRSE